MAPLILFFENGSTLWIDGAWRLKYREKIECGSLDPSQKILTKIPAVQNKVLKAISIDLQTNDIKLSIADEYTIEGFSHTTGDEVWNFRLAVGVSIHGCGGKGISHHEIEPPTPSK